MEEETLENPEENPENEEVADDKENVEGEGIEAGEEKAEGEHVEGEHQEGEHQEGEHAEGEQPEGEQKGGEEVDGEQQEGEQTQGEHAEEKEKVVGEDEQLGEFSGEEDEGQSQDEPKPAEEEVVEEEQFVEEPPPDPAAPYNFTDSQEMLKAPFELRPDQLAEIEQIWELFQNYTPAYTDLDNYITEKELVYMLKALLLMTYTPEQLQELIEYCVRPPHPEGHINFEQFLKMVTMRQRDFPVEEELRAALQVYDPEKTGNIDREYLKETLSKQGHKMPQKQLDNLIKEVDIAGDGTIGVEDVVGTMCIDLNRDDIIMMQESLKGPGGPVAADDDM